MMLYFVLVLKCHPQRLENRQAELQLSLQHKTSAAPGHLFTCVGCCWHNHSSKGLISHLSPALFSHPTICSSKPIKQTDIENKLKHRLFSGSSYIVFHQLLLHSLLILTRTSCNLRRIFQALPFQYFHFLGTILNYHANLVFQCERS